MNKNFSTITSVLIILAVIVGGYFVIHKSDNGWKTYRNEKYGFEIKYPSDWLNKTNFLYEDSEDGANRLFCATEKACEEIDNSPHMPSSAASILFFQRPSGDGVGNNPKYKILGTDAKNKHRYEIYLNDEKYSTVYDQMAESFKFTK